MPCHATECSHNHGRPVGFGKLREHRGPRLSTPDAHGVQEEPVAPKQAKTEERCAPRQAVRRRRRVSPNRTFPWLTLVATAGDRLQLTGSGPTLAMAAGCARAHMNQTDLERCRWCRSNAGRSINYVGISVIARAPIDADTGRVSCHSRHRCFAGRPRCFADLPDQGSGGG